VYLPGYRQLQTAIS